MPRYHTCGVPGCENKGTFMLPPKEPIREDWYRILHLSRKSNSHRICGDHFDARDIGISGTKLRRNVKPTRNLPLNQNPSEQPIQQLKQSSTDDDPLEFQRGDVGFVMQNEIDTQAIYLCDLCSFKCNDIKEYEYHCAALCNHHIIAMEEQTKKHDSVPKEVVLCDKPNEIDLKTDYVSLTTTKTDLSLSFSYPILFPHISNLSFHIRFL